MENLLRLKRIKNEVTYMTELMVVVMVLMVAGFFGYGFHHGMMGDHDKKDQKEESVMHNHDKKPFVTVPVESKKSDSRNDAEELKNGNDK